MMEKWKKTLVIFGALAILLVLVLVVRWNARHVPRGPGIASLVEPIRSKPLTEDERGSVAGEMQRIQTYMVGASSQDDYDQYIPLACERASILMWGGLDYDWGKDMNRDLVRRPLLKILAGKDPQVLGSAAFLVGYHNIQEATPVLIDLLTTRFKGGEWPKLHLQLVVIETLNALARIAHYGNKDAADFLLSHSKIDAWRDTSYSMVDVPDSSRFVWYRLCDALLYYPCEDSIKALEDSGHRYAKRRIHNIRQYLASGDSFDEYCREMLAKGTVSNKYMKDMPFVVPPETNAAVLARWTNSHLVATSTGWVPRVRSVFGPYTNVTQRGAAGRNKDRNPNPNK